MTDAGLLKMGAVGLACAVVSIRPEVATPKWRTFRATMFVGMGLSSVVAVVHGCLKYGASQFNQQMQYEWMIYEGIQYTLGAALYAVRYEMPLHCQRLNSNGPPPRLEFLNASAPERSTSGDPHTRSSTVSSLRLQRLT